MNKPQPQTGPEIEEYSTTATPTAKTEQTNCRTDRPKKSVSRYARISLLILISILSS